MDHPWTIRVARPNEWRQALAVALAHVSAGDRGTRVANALTLLATGDLDPQGIRVAVSDREIVGAHVVVPLRGASGLVWLPSVAARSDSAAIADALMQSSLGWLRERGARFVQALLDAGAGAAAAPLVRAGFRHATRLLYLRRRLAGLPPVAVVDGLRIESYTARNAALFEKTLLRTYEGSCDCPELDGLRSGAEILDGHRAQGIWRAETWWLAYLANEPAGVALLTELEDGAGWDLSYLGVVPACRGRGLGRALALHAMNAARARGAADLLVAVDVRNAPALAIYEAVGFQRTEAKEVYLLLPR